MSAPVREVFRRLRAPVDRAHAIGLLAEYHSRPRSIPETVQWAMHFGSRGLYRVKTLQVANEIIGLAERVAAQKPAIILEIGTARGGTLLIWARLASQKVITGDLAISPEHAELFRGFAPPGSGCQISLLAGDSHADGFKLRVVQELAGRQADFLFIDGDNTEDGVERDFEMYRPLVRPGGLVAFHDIVEEQPYPTNQVHRFWRRIREGFASEELIGDPAQRGYGIGVLRV
jgi:predicted O-methyltransferase YrrM